MDWRGLRLEEEGLDKRLYIHSVETKSSGESYGLHIYIWDSFATDSG